MRSGMLDKFSLLFGPYAVQKVEQTNRRRLIYRSGRPEAWGLAFFWAYLVLSGAWIEDSILGIAFFSLFGYFSVSSAINRTIVELTPSLLLVKERPLPWRRNQKLSLGDVKSVYYESTQTSRRVLHNVGLKTESGARVNLMTSIYEEETARDIRDQLRRWMG